MHQLLKSNGEPKRLLPPSVMGFDFFQLTGMDIFVLNESCPLSLPKASLLSMHLLGQVMDGVV